MSDPKPPTPPRRRRSTAAQAPNDGMPGVPPTLVSESLPDGADVSELSFVSPVAPGARPMMPTNFFQKIADKAARSATGLRLTRRTALAFHLGLPSPSLALSYGLGSNVIPFGKVMMTAGEPGSFKSAFLTDIARCMLELAETGLAEGVPMIPDMIRYFETESKYVPEYMLSILGNRPEYTNFFSPTICGTADDWLNGAIAQVDDWNKLFDRADDGKPYWFSPLMIGIDSIVGAAVANLIEKMREAENVDISFPLLAKKISALSSAMPQMLNWHPLLIVLTNQLKLKIDGSRPSYMPPEERIPGGQSLKHVSSMIFHFYRGKEESKANLHGFDITIKFVKNCLGDSNRRITVPIRWTKDLDEDGQSRQWTMWDWPRASIDLLESLEAKKPTLYKSIADVLDLKIASGKVTSSALGVTKVTRHEAGLALEQSPKILDQVMPLLGIKMGRFFRPGMNYGAELRRDDDGLQPDSMVDRPFRCPQASLLSRGLASDDSDAPVDTKGFSFDA